MGRSPKDRREDTAAGAPLGFTPISGILGGAGLVVILAGYYLLDQGSISLAPALLVLGYGVLLPLALVK